MTNNEGKIQRLGIAQRQQLSEEYKLKKHITMEEKKLLARKLNLPEKVIKVGLICAMILQQNIT